tara:strand:+ start:359 stop:553 length:195 start_codon:yes stop_codon:yes gene_type:complete
MKPEYISYKVGELVGVASTKILGLVTRSNYWALDEYLGGEIQMVDLIVEGTKKQYPIQYLLRVT